MAVSSPPAGAIDVLVIGGGPTGIAVAYRAQRCGLRSVVLERHAIAHSLVQFPVGMIFFTPRATMEIGGVPFDSPRRHPSREDAISYYNRFVRLSGVDVRCGWSFERLSGADGDFTVVARSGDGAASALQTRKVVIATGIFGQPRQLEGISGADRTRLRYDYGDPLRYAGRDVVIVGAGNGAAEAALRLHHAGARVTVLNRRAGLAPLRWRWKVRDLVELRRRSAFALLHSTTLEAVEPGHVVVASPEGSRRIPNDDVIVQIGYLPDTALFDTIGIRHDDEHYPAIDGRTLESNVRGVYVAGNAVAACAPHAILLAGSRHHGSAIVAHVRGEESPVAQDLGIANEAHWRQFERLEDDPDPALVQALVPVVGGESRDDLVDVHQHRYGELDPRESSEPDDHPVIDDLEGWLLGRNADGTVTYKGQRLPEDALEALRLADGTRRLDRIVVDLAARFEESPEAVVEQLTVLFLTLLRTGRLTWRAVPLPGGAR